MRAGGGRERYRETETNRDREEGQREKGAERQESCLSRGTARGERGERRPSRACLSGMCFILISILLSLKSKQISPKHPIREGPQTRSKMAVWPQLRASSTLNGKPSIPWKSFKVGFCVQGKPLLS